MTDPISRRHFFSRLGEMSSQALEALRGSASEREVPLERKNPFPGQLYWDSKTENWKPASGINRLGEVLPSYEHDDTFLTVLEPQPLRSAFWNFQTGDWTMPLGSRDVPSRTVIGDRLVRECYRLHSQLRRAQALRAELQEFFPQLNLTEAFMVGKTQTSEFYPEDLITVIFRNQSLDPAWQEKFGVREWLRGDRPPVFMFKCFLQSRRLQLKFMTECRDADPVPDIALPEIFKPASETWTFLPGGEMSPIRDFSFYATNRDVMDYCRETGLAYPENIFSLDRETHVFGVTYHTDSLKVHKIKRYYFWWLL